PMRVTVINDIQPVPRPALAVLRARKQAIHETLIRVRGFIIKKQVDFIRSRRQANQIEIEPPDQRAAVSLLGRGEPFFAQLGEDEVVDRIASTSFVPDGQLRHWGSNERLERPPVTTIP